MKVTGKDIVAIMKEVGIDPTIIDQLKPDLPLLKQGLDSIDFPVIAVATEKKYGIDFSDADASKLKTLNDLVDFVNGKLK